MVILAELTRQPDVEVMNAGTVFLFTPNTPAANDWIAGLPPKAAGPSRPFPGGHEMHRKRIGELSRTEGSDISGPYIRVRFGNTIDTYRQTSSGRWYKSSRESRPLSRCEVRDDESLPELNRIEIEITEANCNCGQAHPKVLNP